MKPCDLVEFIGSFGGTSKGVLVERWGVDNPGWWVILIDEEIVQWPESQLKLAQEA